MDGRRCRMWPEVSACFRAELGNATPRFHDISFKPTEYLALFITARNSTIHDIIMAELAFAKSFLSALDPKPVKLRADYVLPPEQVDLRGPVRHPYTSIPSPYNNILTKTIVPPPPPSPVPPTHAKENQVYHSPRLLEINHHSPKIHPQPGPRIHPPHRPPLHDISGGSERCCARARRRFQR